MSTSRSPADPGDPPDHVLRQIVETASDSTEFRTSLREAGEATKLLSVTQLAEIVKSCRITRLSLGRPYTKDEHLELITDWLRATKEHDDVVLSELQAGSKRKPSIIFSQSQSQRKMPPPSEDAKASTGGNMWQMMFDVKESCTKSNALVSELKGLLESILNGTNPTKERLVSLSSRIDLVMAENKGLSIGLNVCCEALHMMDETAARNTMLSSPSSSADSNVQAKAKNKISYSAAAQRPPSMKPSQIRQRTKRKITDRHSTRAALSEARSQLRDDSRSISLIATDPNGSISASSVARNFLLALRIPEDHRDIVEDVRQSSSGVYYIQVSPRYLDLVLNGIKTKCKPDNKIDLPNLGEFIANEPTISKVAGKTAIVLSGVPEDWTPSEASQELWRANKSSWKLQDSRMEDHICEDVRLNRRKTEKDPLDSPAWIPTKSLKLWVSKEVVAALRDSHAVVRFDFQFLSVRFFQQSVRRCERCLQIGTHTAHTCRNLPKCKHCNGQHLSKECSDTARTPKSDADRADPSTMVRRLAISNDAEDLRQNGQYGRRVSKRSDDDDGHVNSNWDVEDNVMVIDDDEEEELETRFYRSTRSNGPNPNVLSD